jgi:two-component system, cell cycle response regulator
MKSSGPPKFRSLPPFGSDEGEATSITSFARVQEEVSKSRRVTAYLIVLQGSNVGAMFKLDGPELLIGRASSAQVRLQDDGVSRRHARIIQVVDQLVIEDLQSANGTVVNGEKVERQVLQDGDKIRFGSTTILKFTYHDNLDESFQKQMYEAAIRDGLTKAFNKKYLLDRLATEFAYAQRHRSPLSVVMFDIDHFKRVNDTYGHLAGDAALYGVARLATQIVRTEDVLGRYGGEEFGIICRGVSVAAAAVLAERLRGAIEQTPLEWQGQSVRMTISLGVSGMPEIPANSPTELIAAADEALYESKRSGRNRVSVRGIAR